MEEEGEEITEPFWTTSTGSEMSRKKRSARIAAFAGTIFAAVACLALTASLCYHATWQLHCLHCRARDLGKLMETFCHCRSLFYTMSLTENIVFTSPLRQTSLLRCEPCSSGIMYGTDLAANSRQSMSPHLVSCLALRPLARSVTVYLTLLGITGRVVKVQGQVYNSMSKSG